MSEIFYLKNEAYIPYIDYVLTTIVPVALSILKPLNSTSVGWVLKREKNRNLVYDIDVY